MSKFTQIDERLADMDRRVAGIEKDLSEVIEIMTRTLALLEAEHAETDTEEESCASAS